MLQLDLSPRENEILISQLERDLSDLRMEISHTDRLDYRDYLRQRKAVLTKLLEAALQPARPSAAR